MGFDSVCRAIASYGTSIFTEMTVLSDKHQAINLSQGFPDFDGPQEIRKVAAEHVLAGPNQYSPSTGQAPLRRAVSDKMLRFYGVEVDPSTQVTVTCGATEALSATLLGLLNPGDEVILLEPCYDLYPPIIARAGAKAVFVELRQPGFQLDFSQLKQAFGNKTRAILINNPQNPSGKVFTKEELSWIGKLCQQHDAIAIGDEVYEHIVFDPHAHISLLQVPGLHDRAVVISSTAKTFSMTGWKVGYAVASPRLSAAIRMCHQFLTFSTPGPLQLAMAQAIALDDSYYEDLLSAYSQKRLCLCEALERIGFDVLWPEGTYYASVDISKLDFEDDLAFCKHLTKEIGVAAIPSSYFYNKRRSGRDLVRFCFCKRDETLNLAIERLDQVFAVSIIGCPEWKSALGTHSGLRLSDST